MVLLYPHFLTRFPSSFIQGSGKIFAYTVYSNQEKGRTSGESKLSRITGRARDSSLHDSAKTCLEGSPKLDIYRVSGGFSPRAKRRARECDDTLLSSVEVKNAWAYISTFLYAFKEWCLIRHNFPFPSYYTLSVYSPFG